MNDATVDLINQALRLGVAAKYVLFDFWFTSPRMFWILKKLGLNGLGMIKKSSKIYYVYRQRHYDIKGLYNRLAAAKMNKKNHYLYASIVSAQYHGYEFPLKVVFVSKRGKSRLILKLSVIVLNQFQIQNYDRQCGYLAVTAIAYDLLAWQERQNTDNKTMGDLFYLMNVSLPDIKFVDALVYLISTLKKVVFAVSEKINELINDFIAQLPYCIQSELKKAA